MSVKYQKYLTEYEELSAQLSSGEIFNDQNKYRKISKKASDLEEIVQVIKKIQSLEKNIDDNQSLIEKATDDPELLKIATAENEELRPELKQLKKQFETLTIPKDPLDEKNAILEIRAGAGGDEAALFALELFKMYSAWAETAGFRTNIYHNSKNDIGGIKEIIAQINGAGVYGQLKHESGVHRVQRIPETEKNGRVHTSTVTVAVLPEAEETDLEIKPEEVKIDTYRSSGPGGQSVNTTDSAIRLTHLPTGLVVTCQDEKSQHKNKAKAFSILRSRLLKAKQEAEHQKQAELRSSQIGTGDRSEKIRTYNFPQDRITDHRLKQSWHEIDKILAGELSPIVKALKQKELALKKQNS